MLRILTYHRVADAQDAPHLDPRLISASRVGFERQMRHLCRNYRVIGTDQLLEWLDREVALPPRAVLITFDDAYRDFASTAWPILKRYGLSATLFVATSYPDRLDRAFWWDRLYRALRFTTANRLETTFSPALVLRTPSDRQDSLRRLHRLVKTAPHETAIARVNEICSTLGGFEPGDNGVLGWEELRNLAAEGVTLGAHTRTHPILSRLAPQSISDEILGSQEDLRREIGYALPIISYPDGAHDATVTRVAQEAGFDLGFSTLDGLNDLSSGNRLCLRRTNITPRTNTVVFRIRMLPGFARIDAWRHRREEARA
jgi:peptidoglycan/xylan/chitin deacetylase (PgdA/CDA1 family)